VDFQHGADAMRDGVATDGAAFQPYRGRTDYGIVIHDEEWLRQTVDARERGRVRLIRFARRGWDAHQDVWSFERLAR
jgi:hypothetical protein